jgi:hypothetical protein
MRNTLSALAVLITALLTLSSCEAIGGVFKAGMWAGVVVVVIVVVLVLWLLGKMRK